MIGVVLRKSPLLGSWLWSNLKRGFLDLLILGWNWEIKTIEKCFLYQKASRYEIWCEFELFWVSYFFGFFTLFILFLRDIQIFKKNKYKKGWSSTKYKVHNTFIICDLSRFKVLKDDDTTNLRSNYLNEGENNTMQITSKPLLGAKRENSKRCKLCLCKPRYLFECWWPNKGFMYWGQFGEIIEMCWEYRNRTKDPWKRRILICLNQQWSDNFAHHTLFGDAHWRWQRITREGTLLAILATPKHIGTSSLVLSIENASTIGLFSSRVTFGPKNNV